MVSEKTHQLRINGLARRQISTYFSIALIALLGLVDISSVLAADDDPAVLIPNPANFVDYENILEIPSFDDLFWNVPDVISLPQGLPGQKAPPGSEEIYFQLKGLAVEGASAFSEQEVAELFVDYIGQEISLDLVWEIMNSLTKKYQDGGFFLSRVYIPAQEIEGGFVVLKVAEGHIAKVNLPDNLADQRVLKQMIARLTGEIPLKHSTLERFLLQINDLPGINLASFLDSHKSDDPSVASVALNLQEKGKKYQGYVSVDRYGSRFVGPNQATLLFESNFIPMHGLSLNLLGTMPADELEYGSFTYTTALAANWLAELSLSHVLTSTDTGSVFVNVDSRTRTAYFAVSTDFIRQRQTSLNLKVGVRGRKTESFIRAFNIPQVRERLRILNVQLRLRINDPWGFNQLTTDLKRGINLPSADEQGFGRPSRADGDPDSWVFSFNHRREQVVFKHYRVTTLLKGQSVSGQLLSYAEFGFGGQTYGKAFDSSEFTGDEGGALAVSLAYLNLPQYHGITFTPSIFFEKGKVFNEEQSSSTTVGSAGAQFAINFLGRVEVKVGLAQPLTEDVNEPLRSDGGKARILLQANANF